MNLQYILNFSKKYFPVIFISGILAVTSYGCWPLRIGFENLGRTITSEPEKVPTKNRNPIRDDVKFSALWVGHSTSLVQIEDKVFIFDPLFNDVVGAVILRKLEAGLEIKDIPKLDFVLVSHAHMDHMSIGSINDLDNKFPKAKLIFPVGAEDYLPGYDMDMVRIKTGNSSALGYIGETKTYGDVKITAIYAKHQGGRYGIDSYLWDVPGCTGYIVEYKGYTVLYPGDTAYDDTAYKVIGDKFRINLVLFPIGPCQGNCDSLGGDKHVATRGALMMFDDLKADYMIPVHYGAMQYRDDPRTPLYTLQEIIAAEPVYKDRVKILNEGEQIVFEKRE